MNKINLVAAVLLAFLPALASADDELDNLLFQDTNTVVASSNVVSSEALTNADGNGIVSAVLRERRHPCHSADRNRDLRTRG